MTSSTASSKCHWPQQNNPLTTKARLLIKFLKSVKTLWPHLTQIPCETKAIPMLCLALALITQIITL
jgi:hypothetical protein